MSGPRRPSKAESWRYYKRFVNDLQAVLLFAGTPIDNDIAERLHAGIDARSGEPSRIGILCDTIVGEWCVYPEIPQQETARRWNWGMMMSRFDDMQRPVKHGLSGLSTRRNMGTGEPEAMNGKWGFNLDGIETCDWLLKTIHSFQPKILRIGTSPRFTSQIKRDAEREESRLVLPVTYP